jgi:hypothetical protein
MMISLPHEEITKLMQEWDFAKQCLIQKDFSKHSEDLLVAMMLLAAIELKDLGYQRMNEQWVHVTQLN